MGIPFGSALTLRGIATPGANPPSGALLLYAKSDGKIYTKNSSGVETLVSSGGGASSVPADVRVATTANITLSGTQTIDGVAVAAGDRVLVKDQTATSDNGVYDVSATAWTRTSGYDTALALATAGQVSVREGSQYAGSKWFSDFKATGTLGTTAINWNPTNIMGPLPSPGRFGSAIMKGSVPEVSNGVLGWANRLGRRAIEVTDWNNALDNGWYVGIGAANAPEPSYWFIGYIQAADGLGVAVRTQIVHALLDGTSTDSKTYRRIWTGSAWGSWERLRATESEMDARYGGPDTHVVTDWNNATDTGFYFSDYQGGGSAAANAPITDQLFGEVSAVTVRGSRAISQRVWSAAPPSDYQSSAYVRFYNGATWEPWARELRKQEEILTAVRPHLIISSNSNQTITYGANAIPRTGWSTSSLGYENSKFDGYGSGGWGPSATSGESGIYNISGNIGVQGTSDSNVRYQLTLTVTKAAGGSTNIFNTGMVAGNRYQALVFAVNWRMDPGDYVQVFLSSAAGVSGSLATIPDYSWHTLSMSYVSG